MNKSGVVLITTLLIVMIMSVISMQISKSFMLSLQREAYMDLSNISFQLLLSAEKKAVKDLKEQLSRYQTTLLSSDPILQNSLYYEIDNSVLEVSFRDASNCFNLNSIFNPRQGKYEINKANYDWLKRFTRNKGVDENDIESFVDQLIDWVDQDNQPRNFGAEDYFYTGPSSQVKQYTAKRFLNSLSEITAFPVMSRLNFLQLTEGLCVLPFTNKQWVNINTLNIEDTLLLAAFMKENNFEYVKSIIIDMPEEGYSNTESFLDRFQENENLPPNILSLDSHLFEIRLTLMEENLFAEMKTLVILDDSNKARVLRRNFNL